MMRNRFSLSLALAVVIALGLASRRFPALLPAMLGKYPGDVLWALMVFLAWCFFQPRASTLCLVLLAFSTSCLIEFSQLYQAPWINAIRGTTLGHLVLGSRFSWLDMTAYVVGILIGAIVDGLMLGLWQRGREEACELLERLGIKP